jgi:hypothetical protein
MVTHIYSPTYSRGKDWEDWIEASPGKKTPYQQISQT